MSTIMFITTITTITITHILSFVLSRSLLLLSLLLLSLLSICPTATGSRGFGTCVLCSVCPWGDPWETLLQLERSYSWAPIETPRGQTLRSPRPKVTSVLSRKACAERRCSSLVALRGERNSGKSGTGTLKMGCLS